MHGARTPAWTRRTLVIMTLTFGCAVTAGGCSPQASTPDRQNDAAATTAAAPSSNESHVMAATDSAAGSYLAVVGGCNDCHTVQWPESNGATPHAERLMGNPVGYRGPWGTTYPANLRLLVSEVDEDSWVNILTTALDGDGLPPMPWMNTAQMSKQDLRNLYRYVKALGPAGEQMPKAVPPGEEPTTPFIVMVPQEPGSGNK